MFFSAVIRVMIRFGVASVAGNYVRYLLSDLVARFNQIEGFGVPFLRPPVFGSPFGRGIF